MAQQFRNIIGGKSVDAADGATYDLVDPTTGEVYAEAPASKQEDVNRAMKAAEGAFETWGETTPAERQRALLKMADALEAAQYDGGTGDVGSDLGHEAVIS